MIDCELSQSLNIHLRRKVVLQRSVVRSVFFCSERRINLHSSIWFPVLTMGVCLRVVCLWLLLICFRCSCGAPRIAKPTLRSGEFASEASGRNGRSVEVERWIAEERQTQERPVTAQTSLFAASAPSRSPPCLDQGIRCIAISRIGKRIWDTLSPTLENEKHSLSWSAIDTQVSPALRTGTKQETSDKQNQSSAPPVVIRRVRLSSVSVDPKGVNLSSNPIIKVGNSNIKVSAINGTSTPSPTSVRTTVRPLPTTPSHHVRATATPQKTSPRPSQRSPSAVQVFPPTATIAPKATRRPPVVPKLNASGSGSAHVINPATILLVPDLDIQCSQGFMPDQDGECREVF